MCDLGRATNLLKFLYHLYNGIPFVKIKHCINEPLRHPKVSDLYFSRELDVGSIVTTSGYLSKYCQYFKPASYVSHVYQPTECRYSRSSIHGTGTSYSRQTIKIGASRPTYFPVQALPNWEVSADDSYKIAFLYPESFTRFLQCSDLDKKNILEQYKAIPVLLSNFDFNRLTDRWLSKITARIVPLPDDAQKKFFEISGDSNAEGKWKESLELLMYSHFRPSSELIGFALDGRQRFEYSIDKDKKNDFSVGAYVEGHFINTPENMYNYDFGCFIPRVQTSSPITNPSNEFNNRIYGLAKNKGLYVDDYNVSFVRHYVRDDTITILQKNNIFSLYTDLPLLNERSAKKKYDEMVGLYHRLRINVCKQLKQEKCTNVKFFLDFIWDYRKVCAFDKRGLKNKFIENLNNYK
ncbi:MAG: hypothetical protein ACNI3A_14940 [Desulfovibrio sp.]|uniref:hypothetical protein n=1 Tax=Desulfovibrio sp. 7SRBS1 TaxID=3378064 RepID=UPI003B3DC517